MKGGIVRLGVYPEVLQFETHSTAHEVFLPKKKTKAES